MTYFEGGLRGARSQPGPLSGWFAYAVPRRPPDGRSTARHVTIQQQPAEHRRTHQVFAPSITWPARA
ncbi:hypothetical protein SALB1_2290 [Salinisphaera sp. LB1]|nr:hypothetical protein SALB1_2290 [Salinisphaera sp. LB1]